MTLVTLGIMNAPPIDKTLSDLEKLGSESVMVLDSGDYASTIARERPDIKVVVRKWWDGYLGNPNNFNLFAQLMKEAGVDKAVEEWFKLANLENLRGLGNIWVLGHNEVGLSREYYDFERRRTELLRERYGFGAAVLSLGVGWSLPLDYKYRMLDVPWTEKAKKHEQIRVRMGHNTGLWETLESNEGFMCYHGYSGLTMRLWHCDGNATSADVATMPHDINYYFTDESTFGADRLDTWLAFRFVRYHSALKKMGHNITFFMGEFGFDNVGWQTYFEYTGERGARGWLTEEYKPGCWAYEWMQLGLLDNQGSFTERASRVYAQQLAWAEKQLQRYRDEGVKIAGAAVFTYGSDKASDWWQFDISRGPVVEYLAERLKGEPAMPSQQHSVIFYFGGERVETTLDTSSIANIRAGNYTFSDTAGNEYIIPDSQWKGLVVKKKEVEK